MGTRSLGRMYADIGRELLIRQIERCAIAVKACQAVSWRVHHSGVGYGCTHSSLC